MARRDLLRVIAANILDVEPDSSEDEIKAAYREKVAEYHPDVSDDPNAEEKFKAADTAQGVLLGEYSEENRDQVDFAIERMENAVPDEEVEDMRQSASMNRVKETVEKGSEATTAEDVSDFFYMSSDERDELAFELVLGVETTIIYNSIGNLYQNGYTEDDLYRHIVNYAADKRIEDIGPEAYWEATKEHLREPVTKERFIEQLEQIDQNLSQQYVSGVSLRDVAEAVATFMIQGGINLGDPRKFTGTNPFASDSRFGKDPRFDRGRSSGGKFGKDPRFDR